MKDETPKPVTPMSVGGDTLDLRILYNAVHMRALHMNLENDIDAKEFTMLSKWSAVILQALKDEEHDTETFVDRTLNSK